METLSNWNNQAGDWQRLRDQRQEPRYREIVRVIDAQGAGVKVLDVGCGEAVLADFLNLDRVASYTGVEPSADAIEKVKLKRAGDRVVRETVEGFEAGTGAYDVIVLSEVLYYLKSPTETVAKFALALKPNGILVITIFQKKESNSPVALLKNAVKSVLRPGVIRSNLHCTRVVEDFLAKEKFRVRERKDIASPDGAMTWRMIVAQPHE